MIYGGGGFDTIYGGAGNDYIDSYSWGSFFASGGDGDDMIVGSMEGDYLYGDAGNDSIYGRFGNDQVDGGDGDDIILGGEDADVLAGGAGSDTFGFYPGDSLAFTGGADSIADFDATVDVVSGALNGGGYAEFATAAASIDDALAEFTAGNAEGLYGTDLGQVFMFNEAENLGYLLWDADADGVFESGVVLQGCGNAEAFSELNLV
jgi:Ca2+-binding RTX toxin-like protein